MAKRSTQKSSSEHSLFQIPCLFERDTKAPKKDAAGIFLFVARSQKDLLKSYQHWLSGHNTSLSSESLDAVQSLLKNSNTSKEAHIEIGNVKFCFIELKSPDKGTHSELDLSDYAVARDSVGAAGVKLLKSKAEFLSLHLAKMPDTKVLGSLVGLGMAHYSFTDTQKTPEALHFEVYHDGKKLQKSVLAEAHARSHATNLARHLVNLGPNQLHPLSYCDSAKKLFSKLGAKVEIWDEKKLEKENLNLLLAVGRAAESQPRLLRISHRPRGTSGKAKTVFVGKGITFDSGGLDIKPSQYMRLMKKDMGGSASVLGLAYYVCSQNLKQNIDFYIALAENAVGPKAFRPGDIYKTRKGHVVEIDNTDAEGRLALADALTVAIEENSPEVVIDLATLTGAGKVALGADIASLFANDNKLSSKLQKSAQRAGDPVWPLPLYEKYNSMFSSNFADFQNSAASGYGGAITAALFLKKFVDSNDDSKKSKTPSWAHLDIYGWKDSAGGPFRHSGGNAQCVQTLIEYLTH